MQGDEGLIRTELPSCAKVSQFEDITVRQGTPELVLSAAIEKLGFHFVNCMA